MEDEKRCQYKDCTSRGVYIGLNQNLMGPVLLCADHKNQQTLGRDASVRAELAGPKGLEGQPVGAEMQKARETLFESIFK